MALYFSARQVKLCHARCAGAQVCAPACTLYYAYMFCLSRLFCLFCSGWFHLACLFIHLIKYHHFGWCLFGVVEFVGGTSPVTEVQPFGFFVRVVLLYNLLFYMPKCHFVFVRIFWRNRKWWAMHGRVLVNNIYIYVQTGSFFWITRPLLHQKQAVSDLETTLFFYWNNGFFVLIGTKNIAHIAFIRRNALCRRVLRLHTKTARFCGRMILISEYFSMRTLARITL